MHVMLMHPIQKLVNFISLVKVAFSLSLSQDKLLAQEDLTSMLGLFGERTSLDAV